MATTASQTTTADVTFQKAQNLQRELECTLIKLEKLGLLRTDSGDEIRTIVAEDIADRFDDRYRCFPCGPRQENLVIRRDRIPKTCVLVARMHERSRAIPKEQTSTHGKQKSPAGEGANIEAEEMKPFTLKTANSGEKNMRILEWAADIPTSDPFLENPSSEETLQSWEDGSTVDGACYLGALPPTPPILAGSETKIMSLLRPRATQHSEFLFDSIDIPTAKGSNINKEEGMKHPAKKNSLAGFGLETPCATDTNIGDDEDLIQLSP